MIKKLMRSNINWLIFSAIAACAVFAIVLVIYIFNFPIPFAQKPEEWGQFGDYVGGILNPIFSLLSFIALLITIRLQSQELKQSTEELAKSALALELQNKSLMQQNFENTFFQLLGRYGELVSETSLNLTKGREAFRSIYFELQSIYRNAISPHASHIDNTIQAYRKFYNGYRSNLGHYFRTLYHIFRFIDKSHLSEFEKTIYSNIARAQLSTYELCILFYNGIDGEGLEGFKPLIEKYGILKHVNPEDLLDSSHKQADVFYSQNAFLGRDERVTEAAGL